MILSHRSLHRIKFYGPGGGGGGGGVSGQHGNPPAYIRARIIPGVLSLGGPHLCPIQKDFQHHSMVNYILSHRHTYTYTHMHAHTYIPTNSIYLTRNNNYSHRDRLVLSRHAFHSSMHTLYYMHMHYIWSTMNSGSVNAPLYHYELRAPLSK